MSVGRHHVLWVPQSNLFFDIVTTSWTCCQNGVDLPTPDSGGCTEYSISILGMEGIEHMGRLSSDADAMIFYDGALYVRYENGNIGRVSFTAEGMEEEVLVEGATSDDIGGAVSSYAIFGFNAGHYHRIHETSQQPN